MVFSYFAGACMKVAPFSTDFVKSGCQTKPLCGNGNPVRRDRTTVRIPKHDESASLLSDDWRLLTLKELARTDEVSEADAAINRVLGKGPTKPVAGRRGVFNVCEATVRQWMRLEEFPKPIIIGQKTLRWAAGDVRRWIEEQAKKAREREAAAPTPAGLKKLARIRQALADKRRKEKKDALAAAVVAEALKAGD